MGTRQSKRDYWLHRCLALADGIALVAALALAFAVAPYASRQVLDVLWLLPVLPVWMLLFKAYGLYDRGAKRISHHELDDLGGLFHGLMIGTLLLWLYYRYLPPAKLVLPEVLVFAGGALLLVLVCRHVTRKLVTRSLGSERVLLLGPTDGLTTSLAQKLRSHPEYGLDPVGLIAVGNDPTSDDLPILGRHEEADLEGIVKAHGIERLIVASTAIDDPTLMQIVQECRTLSLKLGILPRVSDALGPSVVIDEVEGLTVLGVNPPMLLRSSRILKRSMDLAGSFLALLLTAPLMGLIAIAIKIDSRGPVLFAQERVGKGGRRFRIRKFRTMVAEAEALREQLLQQSDDPKWLKLDSDPRVTRLGRLLRLTSLDELPQLWSVLKGDMSLVGPRPLIEEDDSQVRGWGRSRLDLTPGITGLWQVLGRTSIPFDEMVKLDYLYVTNWSLWGDVRLLLRTLPAVAMRRGAN